MGASIPVNIAPLSLEDPRPRLARWIAFGVALGCLALLITAATLQPSPSGVGTHTALGLQRCRFLELTGLPCPGCGMTTSFAWFVRGNLLASIYVQPMGAVLAFLSGAGVWAGLYIALTGRPLHRMFRLLPSRYIVVAFVGCAIAAWGWKIFIHLSGHDGWTPLIPR